MINVRVSEIMPSEKVDQIAIENALALLNSHPDYKVIKRFLAQDVYGVDDGSPKGTLMVLDCETTGLDHKEDVMFELGYVLVSYSKRTGEVLSVLGSYSGTEDPGYELSQETVDITGVNYELEVKGCKFDDDKVNADIARTDLIVAHNADFDRRMSEKRFPALENKPWVCSFKQGPWREMGFGSSKLDYLLVMAGGLFHEAHRALVDAQALLHLIALPGADGKTVFGNILEKGRAPSYTVWANDSAFDTKDLLKKNDYRWSDGMEAGKFKAWYKAGVTDPDAELKFLATEIYKRPAVIHIDLVEARDNFSSRYTERIKQEVVPIRNAPGPR